jgi:hypothetical protein
VLVHTTRFRASGQTILLNSNGAATEPSECLIQLRPPPAQPGVAGGREPAPGGMRTCGEWLYVSR